MGWKNGGLWAQGLSAMPQVGFRGRAPCGGLRASPPEADEDDSMKSKKN